MPPSRRLLLPLLLLYGCILPLPCPAQPDRPSCDDSAGGGTLAGHVRDSAGAALAGAQVSLYPGPTCFVFAHQDGSYALTAIAPGTYRVRAHLSGYAAGEAIGVQIRSDAKTDLDLVLLVSDVSRHLGSVPLLPRCRGLTFPDSVTEATRLEASALCAAIAISAVGVKGPDAFCLSGPGKGIAPGPDASPEAIAALGRLGVRVHPMSGCEWTEQAWPLRVRADATSAWQVYTETIQLLTPNLAHVAMAYNAVTLWAGGWECTFERSNGTWYPTACRQDWAS